MKKSGIAFLVLIAVGCLLITTPALGQDKEDEVYVIKKGDTLWDISSEYLSGPHKWPELWERNQYVTNPHLIFPGNPLRLYGGPGYGPLESTGGEEMPPTAVTEGEAVTETAEALETEEEMEELFEEEVVAEGADEPMRGGSEEAVELYRKGDVQYAVLDQESLGTIVDARRRKKLLADGDTVYLAMKERPPRVGEEFLIFRGVEMRRNPYTGEKNKKIYVLGTLQVQAVKGELYQAQITECMDAILRGDEIMTFRVIE
jgi:hypothetical protein